MAPASPRKLTPPNPWNPSGALLWLAGSISQPLASSRIPLCPYHAQGFAISRKPCPASPKRCLQQAPDIGRDRIRRGRRIAVMQDTRYFPAAQ